MDVFIEAYNPGSRHAAMQLGGRAGTNGVRTSRRLDSSWEVVFLENTIEASSKSGWKAFGDQSQAGSDRKAA